MQFPKKPSQVKTHTQLFKEESGPLQIFKSLYQTNQFATVTHSHKQFALNLILPAESSKRTRKRYLPTIFSRAQASYLKKSK